MANIGLLVDCPECKVVIGEQCKPSGKRRPPSWWSHQVRVDAARAPGGKERGMQVAQEQMQAVMAEILGSPYACCEIGFADMGAYDRHVSRGHLDPTSLGLVWSKSGWSSR